MVEDFSIRIASCFRLSRREKSRLANNSISPDYEKIFESSVCRGLRYAKGIGEHGRRWNVENAVRSLVEAWRRVPRALIIASFQRTGFRSDDCFLEIRCDAWEDLGTGVSFEKFVTFDDDLAAADASHDRRGRSHNYDLRARDIVTLDDDDDRPKREISIGNHDRARRASGSSRKIRKADRGKKSSLKRSYDEARLDEEGDWSRGEASNARSNNVSIVDLDRTSRNNEDGAVVAAKLPRIVGVETIDAASRRQDRTRATANAGSTSSRTDADRGTSASKTADREERREDGRALGSERSIEKPSTPRIVDANGNADRASDDDTSVADSGATGAIAGISRPSGEVDENGGRSSRESCPPKRRRSRDRDSVAAKEERTREQSRKDGEPERKRTKPDADYWTKEYETTFVFGPSDIARTATTAASVGTLAGDNAPFDQRDDARRPRRSRETEKSIFTIRPRKD